MSVSQKKKKHFQLVITIPVQPCSTKHGGTSLPLAGLMFITPLAGQPVPWLYMWQTKTLGRKVAISRGANADTHLLPSPNQRDMFYL